MLWSKIESIRSHKAYMGAYSCKCQHVSELFYRSLIPESKDDSAAIRCIQHVQVLSLVYPPCQAKTTVVEKRLILFK